MTKLEQGTMVYEYTYDAEKERIQQIVTDTKDYHYDVWYDYRVKLDVTSEEEITNTFENLRNQARKKQENGNVCDDSVVDKYDVEYYKKPETTQYLVDRNAEYAEVLASNNEINVYGDSLIESNHHIIVTGWNDSVVDKIKEDQIHEIEYNDFGATKGIHSEIGYNGEMQDSNGLIYLRARYYDSSIGRFIQIDNHYEGEQSNVASQNRYAYTLNNPYKYVDRDGNKAKKKKKNYLTMSDKEFKKYIKDKPLLIKLTMTTARAAYQAAQTIKKQSANTTTSSNGSVSNQVSGKGGGSVSLNKQNKKKKKKIHCPKSKGEVDISLIDVLLMCIDWGESISDVVKAFDSNIKFNGVDIIIKHIKEGNLDVRGIKITVSGVRAKVKELTGLTTGPKTKISKILKKSFGTQLKSSYKTRGLFFTMANLISDFAIGVFDLMLGLITVFKFIAKPLGNLLYDILRNVSSSLLKTVLMPFFGPFAWLITLIIDVGIDIIDWFVDLGKEVVKFVEWILKESWSTVLDFVKAIEKLV